MFGLAKIAHRPVAQLRPIAGFTLLELVAVMAILGLVSAALIVPMTLNRPKSTNVRQALQLQIDRARIQARKTGQTVSVPVPEDLQVGGTQSEADAILVFADGSVRAPLLNAGTDALCSDVLTGQLSNATGAAQ